MPTHALLHKHFHIYQRSARTDPTRTLTLRNAFARALKKRFNELRGVIRRAIIIEDVFGLRNPELALVTIQQMQTPGRRAFAFGTDAQKVNQFMDWLDEQVKANVLEVTRFDQLGTAIQQPWTNMYIQSAYQRGIRSARTSLVGTGYNVPGIEETGGIDAVFNMPFHADRVGLLFTRTFRDLKGITDAMDSQISRVLSQGMADGLGPRALAKNLTRTISGPVGDLGLTDTLGRFIPAERRAVILARTEIIRSHAEAQLQEFENWGVVGITPEVEFRTAGDSRVCPLCAPIDGRTFTIEQARGVIPVHPQCRCSWLPVDPTKDEPEPPAKLKIPKFGSVAAPLERLYVTQVRKGFKPAQNVLDNLVAQTGGRQTSARFAEMEAAILQQGTDYKVLLTKADRSIEGALAMTFDEAGKTLVIEHLGTLGNVPGSGAELMRRALARARKKETGLAFQSSDEAVAFYKRLGFDVGDNQIVELTLDQIDAALVRLGRPGQVRAVVEAGEEIAEKVATPVLTTEKALAEWNAAKAKSVELADRFDTEGLKLKEKARLAEEQAYYRYVNTLSEDAYIAERENLVKTMLGKRPKKTEIRKVYNGTRWIPFDMMKKLADRWLKVKFHSKSMRAFYRPSASEVHLYTMDRAEVVAHEFSHALDDMIFGMTDTGGYRHKNTGFLWMDNVYTTEDMGQDFRRLFRATSSGKTGVYANGDGRYWKDNWLDDYEGRIYSGLGAGDEWWAMNGQRYYRYQDNRLRFDKKITNLERDIAEARSKTPKENFARFIELRERELNKLLDEGREAWASRTSKWEKARQRYPELSAYFENMFGFDRKFSEGILT